MLLMFGYVTAALTEVISNIAVAQLLVPVMTQLAADTGRHPLLLTLPVALSCSFAFMLPVATAPNALVYAHGRVTVPDMAAVGAVLNLLAVPVTVAAVLSLGDAVYDFADIPSGLTNMTITLNSS